MIELTLVKNLVPFDHARVSDSNEYNLMIQAFTNDINALLSATATTNKNADDFLVLDTEHIELIKGQLNQLLKKYQSYINLHQKDNFTNVISLDFSSENDRLLKTNSYISDRLYSDPKVPSLKLGDNNMLYINPIKEALQLPIDQETNITIRDIELIHPNDSGSYQNFFHTKDNYEPVSLEIRFSIESPTDISFLRFDSDALYPFNITGASYLDGEDWTDIPNSSILNAFGSIEINFGKIKTTEIKISIDLISCKATNQTINYSYDQFTQYLLENSNLYYTLDNFVPSNGNDYTAFIFHFGLSNAVIGLRTRKNYGIFVSKSATIKEPAQFFLESEHLNDQGDISVEYSIYIDNFDTEGSPIGEGDMVPILRGSDATVVNEVLRPIDFVAKLSFYPKNGTVEIKRNGVVLDPQFYAYVELTNSILFDMPSKMNIAAGPVYTIDYDPVFNGSQFPTPLNDPNSAINKTSIHSASDGDVIGTTITFTLPYNFEDNTVQIDRFINGEIDASAPDPNASMTINGRIITFDHDVTAYPKLTGSDFHISGDTFGAQLNTTELYYYNSDNSLIINWDAFSQIENYSHSEVRLVIMFRRVKEIYTEEEFMADNIFLYSNNFNDLLTSVSNYSGI